MPSKKTIRPVSPVVDLTANINVNDPEFKREIMRPIEIKEDVKLMSTRKRVSLILNSESFRKDLEDIVKLQLHSGPYPDSWSAVHSLADFLVSHTQYGVAASIFNKGLMMPAMPINDVGKKSSKEKGEKARFNKIERVNRCKLASLLRLIDIFGWASGMDSSVSARLGYDGSEYLITPYGLLFHEVTASSLVKVDIKGTVIDSGSTGLQIESSGWEIPSAIYSARPEIRCVIQLRNPVTIAISAMKCGLLPLSQEALLLGKIAVYDPFRKSATINGTESDSQQTDTRSQIAQCLASDETVNALIVRASSIYTFGSSVEEAFYFAFNAMTASETQLRLLPLGPEKLASASGDVANQLLELSKQISADANQQSPAAATETSSSAVGVEEFENLMRQLDEAGYQTGYMYRPAHGGEDFREDFEENLSLLSEDEASIKASASLTSDSGVGDADEVIVPPSIASFGKPDLDKCGGEAGTHASQAVAWSNTPNAYKRTQISEIGTPNPKQITRWQKAATGEDEECRLAVEVLAPDQFAPQGDNPVELLQQQRTVKQHYFLDEVQPGPKSHIVKDGSTDEARKLQDAREGRLRNDHVVVVGAVSRAIIKRDVQHNVSAYRNVYTTNPFQQITDDDLDVYHREVRLNQASPAERARLEAEEKALLEAKQKQQQQQQQQQEEAESTEHELSSKVASSVASKPPRLATESAVVVTVASPTVASSPSAAAVVAVSPASVAGRSPPTVDVSPSSRLSSTMEPASTSEADATHTEVTDTEAGRDAKDKTKKKRRFKILSFRKNKTKE